jgi:hypothetical protein
MSTSWKFDIDSENNESAKIKEKMKKIRHNPKNIPILENIYETEYSGGQTLEAGPILEKPILLYDPIKKIVEKRKGSRWHNTERTGREGQHYPPGTQEKYNSFHSRISMMKDDVKTGVTERRGGGKGEPGVPPREGMTSILGDDSVDLTAKFEDSLVVNSDNYNSLTDLYNKIAAQNKEKTPQTATNILNNLNSSKSGDPDTLKAGNSGFWLPNSDVSDLPKHQVANDESKFSATALLGSAQNKVNFLSDSVSNAMSKDRAALSADIATMKSDANANKLIDQAKSIPVSSPGSKAQSKIKIKGLSDKLKEELKKGADEISYILNTVFGFMGQELKYVMTVVLSVLLKFRDNYNYFVISVSNALTNNNATISEVKIFSSEILKFTTILFTYIFLYNWYFYLFQMSNNEDVQSANPSRSAPITRGGATTDLSFKRIKIEISSWIDNERLQSGTGRPWLYTALGPSLRPTELLDNTLIYIAEYVKKIKLSKPLIFLSMAIIFFFLILGNLQLSMMSNFLKALTFTNTTSTLSIIISVLTIIYAMGWIYNWNCWNRASIIVKFFSVIGALIYLLYSMLIGAPLGVLSISTYVLLYSFLAIVIYSYLNDRAGFLDKSEYGGVYGTIQRIYEEVTRKPDTNKMTGGGVFDYFFQERTEPRGGFVGRSFNFMKDSVKIGYGFIDKSAAEINKYLMEILIIMILLAGINTYTTQYGAIQFEKTDFQNVNSIGSPVSSAFKHLFTWLIIINIIIILLVFIRMWGKRNQMTSVNVTSQNLIPSNNGNDHREGFADSFNEEMSTTEIGTNTEPGSDTGPGAGSGSGRAPGSDLTTLISDAKSAMKGAKEACSKTSGTGSTEDLNGLVNRANDAMKNAKEACK